MYDDQVHYEQDMIMACLTWQPVSVAAAKPYIKAIGLMMTLIIAWVGLCTI